MRVILLVSVLYLFNIHFSSSPSDANLVGKTFASNTDMSKITVVLQLSEEDPEGQHFFFVTNFGG